jgi:acetoin utilization deacetylase AcuC-like enzyme
VHDIGAGHSESLLRSRATEERLTAAGKSGLLRHEEAPRATRFQLERVHERTYVDARRHDDTATRDLVEADYTRVIGVRRSVATSYRGAHRVRSGGRYHPQAPGRSVGLHLKAMAGL